MNGKDEMVKNKALWVMVLIVLLSTPLVLSNDIGRGPGGEVLRGEAVGRSGLELPTNFIPLMVVLGLITLLLINQYKKDKKKLQPLIIGLAIIWIILILVLVQKDKTLEEPIVITGEWQKEMLELTKASDQPYMVDEDYYDINNPIISEVSERLILESSNPVEYTHKVLQYVYSNVKYVWGEEDDACIEGTAPEILSKGSGQCDTQSMVVVSLLRKAGIPSRIVGGCIVRKTDCGSLMGFLDVKKKPLYTPLVSVPVSDVFSRGEVDSRKGGLHAFPQAKLPIANQLVWHTLEATTGGFADTNCYYYYPEIEDVNNKKEICVSQDYDYAYACSNNNNDYLREYGGPYVQ